MSLKKLFVLVWMVGLTVSGLDAVERKKPLPMSELTNPKSRSYVPIPFPSTDDEIIDDLKYYLKKRISPRVISKDIGDVDAEKIFINDFLEGKLSVQEVLRIKNRRSIWERDYYFLVRISNKGKNRWGNFALHPSGLWSGDAIVDYERKALRGEKQFGPMQYFVPYLDKTEVIEQFKKVTGHSDIRKMELFESGNLYLGGFLFPVWEIQSNDETYYVTNKNYKQKDIYVVVGSFNINDPDYSTKIKNYYSKFPENITFLEDVSDKRVVLKKLTAK